jgi:hypothetical protein
MTYRRVGRTYQTLTSFIIITSYKPLVNLLVGVGELNSSIMENLTEPP